MRSSPYMHPHLSSLILDATPLPIQTPPPSPQPQITKLTGEDPTTLQKLGCGAFAGLAAQSGTEYAVTHDALTTAPV